MATAPSATEQVSPRLLGMIVCPRDKKKLHLHSGRLVCPEDHSYGICEGIPILLVGDVEQTHIEAERALHVGNTGDSSQIPRFNVTANEIDPFVQQSIGATNGNLYRSLIGKLKQYPIPKLRMPPGDGASFLEIGCSWGRWCIAAARAGYCPVGIDPSLKGVRAAERICRQMGIDALFLVADGRFLPFPENIFERVFSYSVLQHLSPQDVHLTLREAARVLRPGGMCTAQMANAYGLRCLQHQRRRGFREATSFEVRYWTPGELLRTFEAAIGPSCLSADGFLSLNAQISDIKHLPAGYKPVVCLSEGLRVLSKVLSPLKYLADSLYIESWKSEAPDYVRVPVRN